MKSGPVVACIEKGRNRGRNTERRIIAGDQVFACRGTVYSMHENIVVIRYIDTACSSIVRVFLSICWTLDTRAVHVGTVITPLPP